MADPAAARSALRPAGGPPDLALLARHWLRIDAEGRILALSTALSTALSAARTPAAAGGTGVAPSLIGQPFASSLVPASQLLWAMQHWPALRQNGSLQESLLELSGVGPDRTPWPVIATWCVEPGTTPPSYVGMLTSGHERQRLLADLKRARSSLDAIPGALLQIELQPDRSLRFPYASSTLLELLGVTPAQAAANSQLMLKAFTPESQQRLAETLAEATATGTSTWKVVLTLQRTSRRRLELVARRSATDRVWHGLVTDVSEREQLQNELREQAETDPLTHLANRPALMTLMRQRLQTGQSFAVLFMDCDRFKQVNDSLGHAAGDAVLRALALAAREVLRGQDRFGRWGDYGFFYFPKQWFRIGDKALPYADFMRALGDERARQLVYPSVWLLDGQGSMDVLTEDPTFGERSAQALATAEAEVANAATSAEMAPLAPISAPSVSSTRSRVTRYCTRPRSTSGKVRSS